MRSILAGPVPSTSSPVKARTAATSSGVFAFAVAVAILVWFRGAYVNHDVAWFLVAGRQWIEGAELYTDLSEVNPPLAFYLMRGALHLGDILGLDAAGGLAAFLAVLTGVSLWWCARLVPLSLPRRWVFLVVLAAATTLPFLGHFGQREHLMIVLTLPWVTAALVRDAPFDGPGATLRGLVAGVGICLKPYFLVYPAALVVVECARSRSFRPCFAASHLAMAGVGLAYVALTALLHPEYFTLILPDARLVYGAYRLPFEYVVANIWPVPVALALALLAIGAGRSGVGGRRALALVLAALAAYALQGNGFTYHAAPVHALAVVGLGFMACRAPAPMATATVIVLSVFLKSFIDVRGYRNPLSTFLKAELARNDLAPERLLVWSPSLLPAFPLVLETGAEWSGHAASLWLLPGTLDLVEGVGDPNDPRRGVLKRAQYQMERDLANCPDVLIIDKVLPFREAPLDIPTFGGTTLLKTVTTDYETLSVTPRFDTLKRKTPCHT